MIQMWFAREYHLVWATIIMIIIADNNESLSLCLLNNSSWTWTMILSKITDRRTQTHTHTHSVPLVHFQCKICTFDKHNAEGRESGEGGGERASERRRGRVAFAMGGEHRTLLAVCGWFYDALARSLVGLAICAAHWRVCASRAGGRPQFMVQICLRKAKKLPVWCGGIVVDAMENCAQSSKPRQTMCRGRTKRPSLQSRARGELLLWSIRC